MKSGILRSLGVATFGLGLGLGLSTGCGGGAAAQRAAALAAASVSNKCPDLTKADDVAAFDFAHEYKLSRDAADKLKAAALAAYEIAQLSEKLDAEFGIACSQVAHDLGDKSDIRNGSDACAAAIKAVHDARGKLGPKSQVQLVVHTPLCLVDVGLATKCASICDSSVPASRVKAECERKAGRCDGNCDGVCMTKGARKCDGACSGTCEGTMKGSCGGRCKGTCDGRAVNGPCLGTCAGTCANGPAVGECRGECRGTCKPNGPMICEGLCAGNCSVELSDARCSGEFKPPDVSTDCRARCDLAVINQTECAPPSVGLVVTGAKDRETAEAMVSSVNKAFPALMKIVTEVGDKGKSRVLNAQAIVQSTRTGFKELARSGHKESAAASEAQLRKCFDTAFGNAATQAGTVKVMLDQAIGVRDEVTR